VPKFPHITKDKEILVCSYGGVATTTLIEFVAQYKHCNDPYDADQLKHIDRPPYSRNSKLKVLYIFGDPVDATYSLFRRKYHHVQSKKLLRMHSGVDIIPKGMLLEQYAKEGIDRFKFEQHFENWTHHFHQYPVLAVRYETLWNYIPEILGFLEIPTSEVPRFPQFDPRNKLPSDSDGVRRALQKMYGALLQKLQSFPDTALIDRRKSYRDHLYRIHALVSILPDATVSRLNRLVDHGKNRSR